MKKVISKKEQNPLHKFLKVVLIAIVLTMIYLNFKESTKSKSSRDFAYQSSIKKIKNTPTPISKKNIDPVIDCRVHENCGGGSIKIKQSVCSQTTCCQIGDAWYFYYSKSKCSQDQAKYEQLIKDFYTKAYNDFEKSIGSSVNSGYTYPPNSVRDYAGEFEAYIKESGIGDLGVNIQTPTVAPPSYNYPTINSGNDCYSTWEEYFRDNPDYSGTKIIGVGDKPPCY